MARRAVVGTLAALALGVGVFVSAPTATPPCGGKVCEDEVAAACGGQMGAAFRRCKKVVIGNCKSTTCTCNGTGVPCGSPSGAFLD
jgi:hypothetical protein